MSTITENKIKTFWGLLNESLTEKEKKDRQFRRLVVSVVTMLYLKQVAHINNVFLLDLFSKAGFLVTQEFDGKSWVVVA